MHIHNKLARSQTHTLQHQAELLALLARELIEARRHHPDVEQNKFFLLPEYKRFLLGAYACNFVCGGRPPLKDGPPFEQMLARPQAYLADCSFRTLRYFVHMLARSEHWADAYLSPIRDAIDSGALQLVAERLETDPRLLEPEEVDEVDDGGDKGG